MKLMGTVAFWISSSLSLSLSWVQALVTEFNSILDLFLVVLCFDFHCEIAEKVGYIIVEVLNGSHQVAKKGCVFSNRGNLVQ